MERAGESVRMGRALLTAENLAPLESLVSDANEIDQFKAYLVGLRAY